MENLVNIRKRKPFALFMDNARIHKSKYATAVLEKLPITLIWNVAYSPEYNPIEGCFSVVKNYFKRQRLNALSNGKVFNFHRNITLAFNKLDKVKVNAFIRNSLKELKTI